MPVPKLKPIEERDPYAAMVLGRFDELMEKEEKLSDYEALMRDIDDLKAEAAEMQGEIDPDRAHLLLVLCNNIHSRLNVFLLKHAKEMNHGA